MRRVARQWVILALLGCSAPPAPTRQIGVLLPYSGSNATTRAQCERGMLLATDAINAAGGVAGLPLSLQGADTHSDLTRGIAGATTLITHDGLNVLIGPDDVNTALRI